MPLAGWEVAGRGRQWGTLNGSIVAVDLMALEQGK